MVSVLQLLNSNECAAEVMEILFLFRKLILSQSDTKKKTKNPKKNKNGASKICYMSFDFAT